MKETELKQIEDMEKVLIDYKKKNHIMASHVILKDYAEALYNAGYRKQEWISVEKPPETYRDEYDELIPFLACCKGTVYPFRAVYDGTNWGDGIGKLKVTHWMPLPEPPKTKGGAE